MWDEQHPFVTSILHDGDAVAGGIQMLDELVIAEVTHGRGWGFRGDRHGWGPRLFGHRLLGLQLLGHQLCDARARPKEQSPGGADQAQKGSASDPTPV